MKQYTKSEFANHIRTQYPGSYDDLSDDKLMKLWLKKFPSDTDKIIETESTVKIIGVFLLFWVGVIILSLSLIGLFIDSTSIIKMSNDVVEINFGNDSDSTHFLVVVLVNIVHLLVWLKELTLGIKIGGVIVGALICYTTYEED
jgi:hypothetical protein